MKNPGTQQILWRGIAFAAGSLATVGVRKAAAALWRAERHEDPPTQAAASGVPWRDALVWAVSVGVGAAVARVVAERGAAAAWNAATGEAPPIAA
jgi:hypothetical protein